MKSKHLLVKQSGVLLAGHQIASAFNFFIPIVVVRLLSQHDFGLYKQIFLVVNTCAGIFGFGIVQSLYYFVPGSGDAKKYYVTQTYLMLGLMGLLAASAVVVFGLTWHDGNFTVLRPYLRGLALFSGLSVAAFYAFQTALNSEGKFVASAVFNIVSTLVKAGVLVGALWLTGSLGTMLDALAAVSAASLVYSIFYFRGKGSFSLRAVRGDYLKAQLRYVVPYGLAALLGTLWTNLNQYFVSYLYSPAYFAVYAVGCLQIPTVTLIADSLSNVLLSKISGLKKEGRIDEIRELWTYSSAKLAMVFVPLFAILLVSAEDLIVVLFTERFSGSVQIFRVMSVGLLLTFVRPTVVLRSFAETGFMLKASVAVIVLNVVLAVPLIMMFGPLGSALGFVLSVVVYNVAALDKTKLLLGADWRRVLPWKEIGVTALFSAAAAALALAAGKAVPAGAVSLAVSWAVFFASYAAAVFASPLLSDEEKAYARKTVLRLAGRAA